MRIYTNAEHIKRLERAIQSNFKQVRKILQKNIDYNKKIEELKN